MSVVPPAPSLPAAAPRIRPSKVWYVVGVLLIVAGIAGGIGLFVGGLVSTSRTVDGFGRFVAPASKSLKFQRAGTYTIFYEYRGEVCGEPTDCVTIEAPETPPSSLTIRLTDAAGRSLPVDRSGDSDVTFSFGGRAGRSVASVDIPAAGEYVIEVSGGAQRYGIAIGRGVLGTLVRWILGGIAAGVVGVVVGVVLLIVTGVRRGRRRREASAGRMAPSPYVPGPVVPYGSPAPASPPLPPVGGPPTATPSSPPFGAPPPPPGPLAPPPPAAPPAAPPPLAPPAPPPSSWEPPSSGS
jgi:hypothetical protein